MKHIYIFIAFLCLFGQASACGTNDQREKMAEKLHGDADMKRFVCASDSCSIEDFKRGLKFERFKVLYHGQVFSVCLVEPTLTAANSYTGVFASKRGEYAFQFVSYGAGIKVKVNKAGVPTIFEYSVTDPDNPDYSLNQYLWNGQKFIFSRTVSLHN
ncbi:hypothetical protein QCE47_17735 [Caballeronia sp. LZ025]|uniref:hypothetical protein n=1 Tax=Caballeronia TaxID=1827195 RepID=UPI001FD2740C|nr:MULTISPECIES: hypothetical protein [Caballeronia]MDR5734153.1 hypothetical protein [Caballeronia sp. LZ025]